MLRYTLQRLLGAIPTLLLIATLGPVLGVGAATAVALVSRALMTIGDLVTAGVAAGFTRRPGAGRIGQPPRVV